MSNTKKYAALDLSGSTITFSIFVCLIFVAGWYLNAIIPANWDNDILLHETQKLLAGGTYAHDFFETSPPMIMYLLIPAVLSAKLLSLSYILVFRIYFFLLAALSLWLCRSLGKQIFLKQDTLISDVFFLILTAIILILPAAEIGQREDLFLIFSLPYIFAVAIRGANKPLSNHKALLIGLLAGFGFAIKPFFILTPIFLELYLAFVKRSCKIWWRPESISIFMVLLIYTLIALSLHPDYFHVVIPFAMHLYYFGIVNKIIYLFIYTPWVFSLITVLFFLIQYHTLGPYKTFATALCLALISFIIIFNVQRILFYYHVLPAFSLSVLLNTFLCCLIISKPDQQQLLRFALITLITLTFLYIREKEVSNFLSFPGLFLGFFIFIFSGIFIFSYRNRNWPRFLLTLIVTISFAFGFSFVSVRIDTPFESIIGKHVFLETIAILLILFSFSMRNARLNRPSILVFSTCLVTVFIYPFYFCYFLFHEHYTYGIDSAPILSYMKTHLQNHSLYAFTNNSRLVYPFIDYAGVNSVSRFPLFWMLPGLAKKSVTVKQNDADYQQYIKDKNFLIDMVSEDLNRKKPEFIFMDTSFHKPSIKLHFDIVSYFSENANFRQAWRAYHYVTTIYQNPYRDETSYRIAIFQRDPNIFS